MRKVSLALFAVAAFIALPTRGEAQVVCTPDPGYTTCVAYTFSGVDQPFTVPANVTSIKVKTWGAGGGGSSAQANNIGGPGGSGGYVEGVLAVTPGAQYVVMTGEGSGGDGMPGTSDRCAAAYGFGGACPPIRAGAYIDGGGGGGLSGLFTGSAAVTAADSARAILIAGGGGGGEGTNTCGVGSAAGGAGGNGFAGTMPDMRGVTGAYNGLGGSAPTGGGGGYRGGAATGRLSTNAACPLTSGNGGSNFVAATVSGAVNLAGTEAPSVPNFTAKNPPRTTEPQYISGVGVGTATIGAPGGDGLVVLQWVDPALSCGSGVAQTISGNAQAWTTDSTWQAPAANEPAKALNGPNNEGVQLYSALSNRLELDMATVVPAGETVLVYLANVAGFDGPSVIQSSLDGDTWGAPVTHIPPTTAPQFAPLVYTVPATGARYIRVVPQPDASGHTAVQVDALVYSFEYCECAGSTNFVQQPGFEEFTSCSTQTGPFGNWSPIVNNIHVYGPTCGLGWPVPEGINSIDLDGSTTGGIQQTITGLNPGQRYNLTFYMSFNPAAGALASSMRVQIGDLNVIYTSASNASAPGGGFNRVYVEFTAQSATETLQFHSLTSLNDPNLLADGGAAGFGVVVDDVRVTTKYCDDFSDAPATYGTVSHTGVGPQLGTVRDNEAGSTPNAGANGDDAAGTDDEDALQSIVARQGETTASAVVTAINPTASPVTLAGWIDVNGNGTFDANERAEVIVPASTTTATPFTVNWSGLAPISVSAGTTTYARFRIGSAADVANPTGAATSGEVEDHAFVVTATSDLAIAKTASPEPYRPGTTVTYTITVTNAGPSPAINARVQDTFPAPMSGFTWTCAGAGGATCGAASGANPLDALVTVPVGGTITFTATGVVPVSTTTTETNAATVTPAANTLDPNLANNGAVAVSTPILADVSITKVDLADPVAAADAVVYTLTVSNAGPFPATSVTVSDPLPAGTSFVSASGAGWTCAESGGVIGCTLPSLTVGAPSTITVSVRAPNQPTVITNTATVSASEVDPITANNTDDEPTTITPRADLAISKVSTPKPYVPGTSMEYTLVVSNLGPSDAAGATVSDTLPGPAAGFTWTCVPNSSVAACGAASGSGPTITTTVDLAVGSSVTIVATGPIPSGFSDVLTNTATVTAPAGIPDPVLANNEATDVNPADLIADLRISKASTPNPYVPGEALTYTVVVTNAGPSDASGARVRDPLPPTFAGFTWTCVAGPGAACATTSGTGDVDALVDLPVGTTATFTSAGMVPSSYAGLATNTATITPPADVHDPVPGNNVASAQNPPNIVADLVITKAQTPDPYVPGAEVTYMLLVTNMGPSDVANARVQDVLPGVVTGATWSCAAAGAGAACGALSGVNVVDALVTLPVGTSATFTITGTVLPSATGVLSNTATVTPPSEVTDPVPGNNEATVNSGPAPLADLAIVKTASQNPYVPGAPLSFTIVASNAGPSDAPNARVQDLFPPALSGFTWTCAPSAGAATCGAASGVSLIDVLVNLPVGGAVTFTVSGIVPPDATGPLTNTATVAPPIGTNDPTPANNLSAVTVGYGPQADLSVTKTSAPNPYVPGSPITYTIVASNAGPSVLFGGRVRDGAPAVLQNVTWTCSAVDGTCPAPSGTGNIDALVDIAPGGTVTFTLTGDVPGGTRGTLVNAATIVPPTGTEDPNPPNNTGTNYNPSIPIPGPADLQITQEFPGVAPPNGLLTFRLRTRNLGSNVALNPYMTGLIPPGTTFVSVTPSDGGMCNTPGNPPAPDPVTGYPIPGAATEPLRCTWPGLMPVGASHYMDFTVRVAPGTPTGQILWSCWWTWSETEDPYHANNVVDAYLFVHDGTSSVGDLSIQAAAAVVSGSGASADRSGRETYEAIGTELPVRVGGTVKMRFSSTNAGPAATRGQYALILDEVAIGVVDVTVPQGWVSPSGPSSAVWDTGVIQPGQTVNLDLTVRVHTTGAVKLFAQRIAGSPGDPNASNEHAEIVLDGYGPGAAGRWVAVGNVDAAGAGEILTGAGQGETPQVRVFTGAGADTGVRFFAYERPFLGGVQIASCDVNGDGISELITAPGVGRAPTIRVLSLLGGVVTELIAFDAFEPNFTGGASVACADLDADGSAEVVIGAGPGRAPEVQVYNVGLSSIVPRATFLAYEAGFLGGVRVAAGVYPGRAGWLDAFAIATTPGPGRAAELRLFTPTGAPVAQVVVSSATKGVLPTLGDVNGDGQLDLLLAPDDGRPELVRIFEVDTGTVLGDVEGGLPAFPVGIRTAVGLLDGGPGQPEIVIGNGPGGHPRVRVIYWPPAGPVQRLEILPLEIP